jgi:hypothetical protein
VRAELQAERQVAALLDEGNGAPIFPAQPSVYRGEMHGAASLAESRRDSASARAPLGRPDEPGLLGGHCGQWRRMVSHGCAAATGCYTPLVSPERKLQKHDVCGVPIRFLDAKV